MSRPEKQTLEYFPFFCQQGKKMFYLERQHGNDGYATFVKILVELANTNNHYLNLNSDENVFYLAAKCNVNEEKLLAIIDTIVKTGKFDKEVWKYKIVWCDDFAAAANFAYLKRKSKCIDYQGLLLLLDSLGIRKLQLTELSDAESTQSKVKKSKVNKSKENKIYIPDENSVSEIPEYDVFLAYALTKKPNLSKQHLRLKFDAWVENGWKDGNNKKIVNWKTKILNTLSFINEDKNVSVTGSTVKNKITF